MANASAGFLHENCAIILNIRGYYGWDATLASLTDQHGKALMFMLDICLFNLSILNIGAAGDSGFSTFSSLSLVSQKALHVNGLMS